MQGFYSISRYEHTFGEVRAPRLRSSAPGEARKGRGQRNGPERARRPAMRRLGGAMPPFANKGSCSGPVAGPFRRRDARPVPHLHETVDAAHGELKAGPRRAGDGLLLVTALGLAGATHGALGTLLRRGTSGRTSAGPREVFVRERETKSASGARGGPVGGCPGGVRGGERPWAPAHARAGAARRPRPASREQNSYCVP